MIEASVTPRFLKSFKKLHPDLKDEVRIAIKEFSDPSLHEKRKVHKLKGRMEGYYSFSVNYKYRVVFSWEKKNTSVILRMVGDHSIYN
ncbi:MAG: type II toxin-antitoxin system YafQ family toxin [Patescibacteria group bacterium UBA2103]